MTTGEDFEPRVTSVQDSRPMEPEVRRVLAGQLPPWGFDAACTMVLDYLSQLLPMGLWAVTRISGEQQVMLAVNDTDYGFAAPGQVLPFASSMCRPMLAGDGPRIAPDTGFVPAYAAVAATAPIRVAAYVGTPIVRPNGELFGTVCGYDPKIQSADMLRHLPLMELLTALLSSVLEADRATTATQRELEQALTDADTDVLTGLLNRRGWDRFLQREDDRYRRFGDPAFVVMLDLDLLKQVNDTRGHEAGDRYIQAAAQTVRANAGQVEAMSRLGGDEFAMLIRGSELQGRDLIEDLEQALEEAGAPGSFGFAPYSVVSGFPGACAEADAAMYERKRQRRARRPI